MRDMNGCASPGQPNYCQRVSEERRMPGRESSENKKCLSIGISIS